MSYRSVVTPSIPGVLFAEDFGDDDECEMTGSEPQTRLNTSRAESDTPPAIDVVLTAKEIEEDRNAARNEGFSAGLRAAENELSAERTRILDRLEKEFSRSFRDINNTIERGLDTVADVAVSTLVTCFPLLCEQYGASELTALIRALLPGLMHEPELIATVHPSMEEVVRQQVAALTPKPEQVLIRSSRDMLIGDVTLTWKDGAASRNVGRWQTDMIERLAKLGGDTNSGSAAL